MSGASSEFNSFERDFHELIERLRDGIHILREFNISSESDVIGLLASILRCDSLVRKKFLSFELEVDILCPKTNIAIEVEIDKTPYEGIHQAIAYSALLGYNSILLHVVSFSFEDYLEAIRRLFKYINKENIRGILINVRTGEVVGI